MVNRKSKISKKKRIVLRGKQIGGSPAYKHVGDLGLLSRQSMEHSPLGLTQFHQNFSKHIVSTSGGGRTRNRQRRTRRKRKNRSKRRGRSKK